MIFINNLCGVPKSIFLFIKTEIMEGVDLECRDKSCVWLKLKSSFFYWDSDKIIACVYFPPIDSSYLHSTNTRTYYFNILTEHVAKFHHDGDIFNCGDFNFRTGQLHNFSETIPGT